MRSQKKKLVVVLGMHRSGTSVITRGLKVLGVELGSNMIPSYADNIKGFWEDADFKSLNAEMLSALGLDWHSLDVMVPRRDLPDRLSAFRFRALNLLKSKTATDSILGVKDPRFSRLLPFWKEIFDQASLDVCYVIPVRNPLSVAHSLKVRNNFDLAKSLALWQGHMLLSVLDIDGAPALIVDYDAMLARPEYELTRIADALDLPKATSGALSEYAAEYLENNLRHTCYGLSDLRLDKSVPVTVTETFVMFLQLSRDEVFLNDSPVRDFFIQQQNKLEATRFLLVYVDQREALLEVSHEKIDGLEKTIQRHVTDIEKQSAAITERNQAIVEKNLIIKEKDKVISELQGLLFSKHEEMKKLLQSRELLIGEKNKVIVDYQRSISAHEHEQLTQQQSLQNCHNQLSSLNAELLKLRRDYAESLSSPELKMAKKLKHLFDIRLPKSQKTTVLSHSDVDKIRSSGLFDATWYLQQLGEEMTEFSALEHYLLSGWKQGLSPHPLFDGEWYVNHYHDLRAGSKKRAPLLHYLEHGGLERRWPHPAFDADWYLECNPDVHQSGVNPLVHYQFIGSKEGRQPNKLFDSCWYVFHYQEHMAEHDSALSHYFANTMGTRHFNPHPLFKAMDYLACFPAGSISERTNVFLDAQEHVRQYMESPSAQAYQDRGILKYFDIAVSRRFAQDIRRYETVDIGSFAASPKISIIMPTHNRLDMLPAAVESILAQTYPKWELCVVDDGSEDETFAYLTDLAVSDKRIRPVRIKAQGVCHARNAGLALASGELIAYLDSDNTWAPDFLEVMQAFLQREDADFVYSAVKMFNEQGISYRFCEFDAESLMIKNFIDLNAVMHLRRFYDELAGFDEQLARMVDWDLIIRYTKNAKVRAAPFLGVNYDNRKKADRITVKEPVSWRYSIMNKHMIDWQHLASTNHDRDEELVSVVIPIYGQLELTRQCVIALQSTDAGMPFEIILVDNGSEAVVLRELYFWSLGSLQIKLVRNSENFNFALGCNLGFAQARGRYVVFLNNDTEVLPGWLASLVKPLQQQADIGAVQPKLIYPDGRIQGAGVVFSEQSSIPYPIYSDSLAEAAHVQKSRCYQAVSAACIAVRSEDFIHLHGFDPLYINGQEDIDFCLRLGEMGLGSWYEASASVIHHESRTEGRGKYVAQNRRLFMERWQGRLIADDLQFYTEDGFVPVSWRHDGFTDPELSGCQPVLAKIQDDVPPTCLIAIKVPCPDESVRHEWGDYHFARSLGAAFLRAGYRYRIDFLSQWGRGAENKDEVNLVLRGLSSFKPREDQINLMWMISHPDKVSLEELRGYDHIFVASTVYAKELSLYLRDRVSCLLQCTDPGIFYPNAHFSTNRRGLLFVGNSRNQFRDVIKKSLEAGLTPNVYGTRWQQFIPAELIKGENIPNRELGHFYRDAGVVLNDHWQDMRDKGFVSNRIFDVLACGTPVVSDRVNGMPDDLREGIYSFYDDESFKWAIAESLQEGYERRQTLFRLALHVQANHGFDTRVVSISAIIRACFGAGLHPRA